MFWSAVEKFSSYGAHFLLTIVLARLLCGEDYAVVAMMGILYSLSQTFIDGGLTAALIQRHDCTDVDFSSVCWMNILVSLLMYALLFLISDEVEAFYGFEGLSVVVRVYMLSLVITAVSRVHNVMLVKSLRFRILARITLAGSVVGGCCGIVMAVCGMGYWSLVGQTLASTACVSALTMWYCRWKPCLLPSDEWHWRAFRASMRRLGGFGGSVLCVSLLHAVYNNLYSFVLGKWKTAAMLGSYDRGRALGSFLPIGLSDFTTHALLPVLSKVHSAECGVQNDDGDKSLLRVYLRAYDGALFFVVPVCVWLSVFCDESVHFLIGSGYAGVGALLNLLAVGYMLYPLERMNVTVLKARGCARALMVSETLKKVVGALVILFTVRYNLETIAFGYMLFCVFEWLVSVAFLRRTLPVSLWAMFARLISVLAKTLTAIALVLALNALCADVGGCGANPHLLISLGDADIMFYLRYVLCGVVYVSVYAGLNYKRIRVWLN